MWTSFSLAALLLAGAGTAEAVSGTSSRAVLTDGGREAVVNGAAVPLTVPAVQKEGDFYVPARWVGETVGHVPVWHGDRGIIGWLTPNAYLEWDFGRGVVAVNGVDSPIGGDAYIQDGNLMVRLAWIATHLGVTYRISPESARAEFEFVSEPARAYEESAYPGETQPNSRPVAKFMPGKPVYRPGEPVKYVDLSYDPDAEGLPVYEWSGNEPAFFAEGTYPVTLVVKDGKGNVSLPFTRTVTIAGEPYLSKEEYAWHATPIGSVVPGQDDAWEEKLVQAPEWKAAIRHNEQRPLISAGEAVHLTGQGTVYEAPVSAGAARLYAHPVNASGGKLQWVTAIRNPDGAKRLFVKVTRAGETAPSWYHPGTGAHTAIDFLSGPAADKAIEIGPGETAFLHQYAMESGQAMSLLADLELDGDAVLIFAATAPGETAESWKPLQQAEPAAEERGTYAASEVEISAPAGGISEPARIRLKADPQLPPIAAVDGIAGTAFDGRSGHGVTYRIRLDYPRELAIGVRPGDGVLKGAFKVNGNVIMAPEGGVTPADGYLMLHRTEGTEKAVEIEYTPAPGSAAADSLILIPLLTP